MISVALTDVPLTVPRTPISSPTAIAESEESIGAAPSVNFFTVAVAAFTVYVCPSLPVIVIVDPLML
jgi:hypothetical protein